MTAELLEQTSEKLGVYRVSEAIFPDLQAHVNKLSKRAAKLGLAPIELKVLKAELVELARNPFKPDLKQLVRILTVEVTGGSPKLNGWHFVATIHRLPDVDGNIILAVPGETVPELFHDLGEWCDHCNARRIRKDTYLVRHDDGTYKQVGSNCLKDFLGGWANAQALARYAEDIAKFNVWEDEMYGYGGDGGGGINRLPVFLLKDFLAVVARQVRQDVGKFRTSKQAYERGGLSTAQAAWQHLTGLAWGDKWSRQDEERFPTTDDDYTTADLILNWATENLSDRDALEGEYLINLSIVFSGRGVDEKTKGLVASAWLPWQRAERQAEALKGKSNEWLGEAGQKLVLKAKLTKTYFLDGYYGPTTKLTFEDEAGNSIVWWASGDREDLEAGTWFHLKGTVKKLDDYKGRKQTVLTRCKRATV